MIGRDDGLTTEANILAKNTWKCNDQGRDKDGCHDGEGENPLERNDLSKELTDTKTCAEHGQGKAHSVILVSSEEEQCVNQDTPNSNVGQNTCRKAVSIDHDCTVPVDGDESPGQRPRNDGNMDKSWRGWMAEV